MIRITIERGPDGKIRRFTVSGHAYYGDPGTDIVCAGVSAVAVGAVNAIEKLTGRAPRAEMRSGWLSAEAPAGGEDDERVQLLLEGMLVSLETIADAYAKHVSIRHKMIQEGG